MLVACHGAEGGPVVDGERPPRQLSEPSGEFATPFSSIRAVLALPDGRLVVSDPQESRVVLIDFAAGTRRLLSRVGEGPREFRRPGGLYRAPGGGIFVFDQALWRLLPVSAAGVAEEVVGPPVPGIADKWSIRGPDPFLFDSLGNYYQSLWKDRLFAPASNLLRHRPGAPPDTLIELQSREIEAVNVKRSGLGTYREVLFSPEDAWVVAPDGWVAIARADPYRVDWVAPDGRVFVGPRVGHRPVRIPREEKALIASGAGGWRGHRAVRLVRISTDGPPPSGAAPPAPLPVSELRFAEVKSPVNLRDDRWPLLDEHGRLWVERSRPWGADASVFDVFDRTGNLVERIELPPGSRLVGFDRQWLYAARRDPDDLEYLQRFAMAR